MGFFNRKRGLETRFTDVMRRANQAMAAADQPMLAKVQAEFWAMQRECLPRVLAGDRIAAGILFDLARASIRFEMGARNWTRAVACGWSLACAVAYLDQHYDPLPKPLLTPLRRHADLLGYAAHRAGLPYAGAIIAEGLTSLCLGDRTLQRSIALVTEGATAEEDLSRLHDTQRQRVKAASLPLPDFDGDVAGLDRLMRDHGASDFAAADLKDTTTTYPLISPVAGPVAAIRRSGRSLLYLCGGAGGGTAILLGHPSTGAAVSESIELPDFDITDVAAKARALRVALAAQQTDQLDGNQLAEHITELLAWLGEVMWRPILRQWPHLRTSAITLIPVGEAAALPLYTAMTDGRPACTLLDLTIAPSARSLVLAGESPAASGPVLVAADPAFGHDEIQYAVKEANAVAAVHQATPMIAHEPSSADRPEFRLRAEAHDGLTADPITDHHLLPALRSSAIVHLACHGHINLATPLDSALELDGAITLSTILDENLLPGCLVVLSACDLAGIGADNPGEQLGFPAVLLAGGARSVVAALWPVPDSPRTVRLMTNFHENLLTSTPTAALGAVIGQAHNAGVPPTQWAPFTHFGA